MTRARAHRILIYSHDSFGLGHLRRCRAIAHALVDHFPDLSVLILSGSPIIGSFSFKNRVDFVRIPGVIKLRRGDYTSLSLEIGIEETLAVRAAIIRRTAEVFEPDIFLVDKEPLGLRGEVRETLEMLKARGVPLVLGLRDVMDDPASLVEEWERKQAIPALANLYDQIWVYGLRQVYDPLAEVPMPKPVKDKIRFTGYLRRSLGRFAPQPQTSLGNREQPYLLVTTGGGGDGTQLVDWVLSAYEADPELPMPALVVLGPFMRSAMQGEFLERVERLERVEAITFDANVEALMAGSAGIVAMGGYNTFCEILSFDKPSVIVPRTEPRAEQLIRASRANDLGLAQMLIADDVSDPTVMARALRDLPHRQRPSEVRVPGLLDGLDVINEIVTQLFAEVPQKVMRLTAI